jgi:radical SAM superfamily enzyme YgiQ (UPF0313 family)
MLFKEKRTFSPCVAVSRDERWGRTYESMSEDPELVSNLAAAIFMIQRISPKMHSQPAKDQFLDHMYIKLNTRDIHIIENYHADSIFLGEVEDHFEAVLADLEKGKLKKVYDYLTSPVPIEIVGTARRSILNPAYYRHNGIQLPDLIHASRGCRFNCYPCCVEYLGGRSFRPRPIEKVVEEVESINNVKLFFVDNSLAQDGKWEIDLFNAIKPLKRRIISHPVKDDPAVLKAAADAGLWWVYQAIFDTSDYIRDRVKRLKDHGVYVEGTILLGLDEQCEDDIKRLVDFLLEIELDLAEFTVLTPFPHTRATEELEAQGRILSKDWKRYNAGEVVFQPAKMSVDKLQELYQYAWDTFYTDESQEIKMAKVLKPVIFDEMLKAAYAKNPS